MRKPKKVSLKVKLFEKKQKKVTRWQISIKENYPDRWKEMK